MTFQAIARLSNRESLCIGEITAKEADLAAEENPAFDGYGLYLIAVDTEAPSAPGRILAKFASDEAAQTLARFFRFNGVLEAA
ncbi:MAG TPA: hypothetical protein VGN80_19000 [Devosiaceae bacterium]|jgi:hypothetical protein|nr:hypothetical protein [Devosiaceae bacterium]